MLIILSKLLIAQTISEDRVVDKQLFGEENILNLKTNLLQPISNIGVEIPVAERWTVGLDYYFPWYLSSNNSYCYELLAGYINTKYWFNQHHYKNRQAIGAFIGIGHYDFQFQEYNGHQGRYFNLGCDYTYVLPSPKCGIRIELNVGFGYLWRRSISYNVTSDKQHLIGNGQYRNKHYFGPTKAEVSIVIPIKRSFFRAFKKKSKEV